MSAIDPLPAVVGVLLIVFIALDVFEAVLLPRPTPRAWRLARLLVRTLWPAWRRYGMHVRSGERRDRFLGMYAPLAVVVLLVCWLALLVVGFGLLFYALRGELSPSPDLGTAIYEAGTAILTLGFVNMVATGAAARIVALTGAAAGLGVVALVITYLFMLFGSFQRRETLVVELDSRAGSPPSGVALIKSFASLDLLDELPRFFEMWGTWSAEVLDSHVAYPILGYFRSSHDNTSWLGAIGAVLDAACLVRTTLPDLPQGHAELTRRIGSHLVEDISNFMHLRLEDPAEAMLSREEFDEARHWLAHAGLRVVEGDEAWAAFEALRASYADRLEAMARYWAAPRARWTGGRQDSHSA